MSEDIVRVTDEETPVLMDWASDVPENGLILEIGACWGYSIAKMAAASHPSVNLITIDPWTLRAGKHQAAREARFYKTIKPYKKKITPVKGLSEDVHPAILLGHDVDLLFIDGDHSYDAVKADYLKWSPFVKVGGRIVFHDYTVKRVPGIRRVIDEIVIPSGYWEYEVIYSFWSGVRNGRWNT